MVTHEPLIRFDHKPECLIDMLTEARKWRAPGQSQYIKPWWRGVPVSGDELLRPSLYRKSLDPGYEKALVEYFRNNAPIRYPDCPTNPVDWLFLMQHYGLPTRILDWTTSPLVALFFAVWKCKHDKETATLWMLLPGFLNKPLIHSPTVPLAPQEHHLASRLAQDAFDGFRHDDRKPEEIFAIQPPHTNTRMFVQQAVSTIHGTKTSLEQLERSPEFLLKIAEIPPCPNLKDNLRGLLDDMGINKAFLFPDIEHYAEYIQEQIFATP